MWQYSCEKGGEEEEEMIDYVAIDLGCDGMINPKVSVIDDGWVCQVASTIPPGHHGIAANLKARMNKLWEASPSTAWEKAKNKREYNALNARLQSSNKARLEVKDCVGAN